MENSAYYKILDQLDLEEHKHIKSSLENLEKALSLYKYLSIFNVWSFYLIKNLVLQIMSYGWASMEEKMLLLLYIYYD